VSPAHFPSLPTWGHPARPAHFASTLIATGNGSCAAVCGPGRWSCHGSMAPPPLGGIAASPVPTAISTAACRMARLAFVLHLPPPRDTFADNRSQRGSYTCPGLRPVGCQHCGLSHTPFAWLPPMARNHLEGLVTASSSCALRGQVFADQGCSEPGCGPLATSGPLSVEVVCLE